MLLLYIRIDYEPIKYLLPINETLQNVPFNRISLTPPPLCAVHSPINLTEFFLEITNAGLVITQFFGTFYRQIDLTKYSLSILQLIPNDGSSSIQNLDITCNTSTQWEMVSSPKYRITYDFSM